MLDYFMGGQAHGSVATALIANGGDPRALRPWVGNDGRTYVSQLNSEGKEVVVNAPAATGLLRKDAWIALDTAVVKAARQRLGGVADLIDEGLELTIPNGLGRLGLDYEVQSDVNEATIDMDGIAESQNDRPTYGINQIPLPMIHADFWFSTRQLIASRNSGSPLDTSTAELKARMVAEQVEKLLVGSTTFQMNTNVLLSGYTTLSGRMTKTMTSPTATGWTALTTLNEVIAMVQQAKNQKHYGPYALYTSLDWDQYLDEDYKTSAAASSTTLRQRLEMIRSIKKVKTLDFLPTGVMILVQLTPDVVRIVNGCGITTVQWESHGGMRTNFKVFCVMAPNLRLDANGNGGIVHGSHS